MPLADSEAIVLRNYPLGEGDLLVSFLSRGHGRLRGVARGARRPKSRFGSTLEPLSLVHIWFFEKENRDLVRISQCELQESFLEAQRDFSVGVGLGVLSEISETLLPEREPGDSSFRLLLLASREMKNSRTVALPLAYFALWMLRLGGWLPELTRCTGCGRELGEEGAAGGGVRHGLFCRACRLPGMRNLTPGARRLAVHMLAERLEKIRAESCTPADVAHLTGFALDLIEQQSEKKLVTRRLFESMAPAGEAARGIS